MADDADEILYGATDPRTAQGDDPRDVELKLYLLQALGHAGEEPISASDVIINTIIELRRERPDIAVDADRAMRLLTELVGAGYASSFSMGVLPSALYQITDKGQRLVARASARAEQSRPQ